MVCPRQFQERSSASSSFSCRSGRCRDAGDRATSLYLLNTAKRRRSVKLSSVETRNLITHILNHRAWVLIGKTDPPRHRDQQKDDCNSQQCECYRLALPPSRWGLLQ